MIIQLVRYKSGLPDEEVLEQFDARSGEYREVQGLLQKYYVRFPDTGEHGGVYVWDSEASLRHWRETDLAGTLAETYKVEDEPHSELLDVVLVLHPEI
jgi:heme-degrading monooxygenase HmoA